MFGLETVIQNSLPAAIICMAACFVLLFKCADLFVDAAVGIAEHLRIPRLVIGLVLVSLATTAPELAVSITAALRGIPEIALGNAIGSVLCDDGLALGLAGVVAAGPIAVMPSVFRGAARFLLALSAILVLFTLPDATLGRAEGAVLLVLFAGYTVWLIRQQRREPPPAGLVPAHTRHRLLVLAGMFCAALVGIIICGELVITAAVTIARAANISESVIALTLVAFGTSVPEIATCISAARKGEGAIAVGNILGADIMNICWVAGASALAHPLVLSAADIRFMLPSLCIMVLVMLGLLRHGHCLTRTKGCVLLLLYAVYLTAAALLLPTAKLAASVP